MLLIPNDTILHFCSICLVFCIALEVFDSLYFRRKQINESTTKPLVYNFPVPPVHYGCLTRNTIHMDVLSSSKYMPRNVIKSIMLNEVTKSDIVFSQKRVNKNSKPSTKLPVRAKHVEEVKAVNDCDFDDDKIYSKIMTVLPPGCEPYGPNANAMAAKFSQLTRPDIVRYLVARKGNVALAEEMAEKCLAWRAKTFPLKKEDVEAAMNTGCFFPHRTARDGSPVVYMRGGLYDNVVATPEQFVKAAAHAIEWSLQQHPGQINVTVIVHTVNIPGAPNLGADMNFIKQFVQVLSDNFPERLRRIVIFPFPWYGRAIWSVVKVFVDKRTQDKAMLLSDSSGGKGGIPPELSQFVDPDHIPECCAGRCKQPIIKLIDTLS